MQPFPFLGAALQSRAEIDGAAWTHDSVTFKNYASPSFRLQTFSAELKLFPAIYLEIPRGYPLYTKRRLSYQLVHMPQPLGHPLSQLTAIGKNDTTPTKSGFRYKEDYKRLRQICSERGNASASVSSLSANGTRRPPLPNHPAPSRRTRGLKRIEKGARRATLASSADDRDKLRGGPAPSYHRPTLITRCSGRFQKRAL